MDKPEISAGHRNLYGDMREITMELATRAYAALEVKALGDGKRTFSGWATTPAVDRIGDTIDPMGVTFKNPMALLHQHRHDMPIGTVMFGKPTAKGI